MNVQAGLRVKVGQVDFPMRELPFYCYEKIL